MSKEAEKASGLILDAFEDYNARFSDITRRAARRFQRGDHAGMQADTVERIALYDQCIRETHDRLEHKLGGRLLSRRLWQAIRGRYAEAIHSQLDAELYKTFFNTLSRRLFHTRGVAPDIEFVALDIEPTDQISHPVARDHFAVSTSLEEAWQRVLLSGPFRLPHWDRDEDARLLSDRLMERMKALGEERVVAIELLQTVFYRDGRAYRVGRIFGEERYLPCALVMVNRQGRLQVDALLTGHQELSILFGYTHNYFLADLPTVGDAVVFLRTILPHKPLDELYTVLGRIKQGKTERYRHFFRHLQATPEEKLVTAAGTAGMVMLVFTLPSYPLVFKVIRDHFGPAKPFGRARVIERYRMVFRHERGGRLVDAQSYRHLRFPRERFDPDFLDQLLSACGQSVTEDNGDLIISHCYVERRVTPLNLYLPGADQQEQKRIIHDYGQALVDLAHADIFPGDLLLKNFGVTRNGRVIFYDYDEIRRISECRFRPIPRARDEVEELSDETWYTVSEGDVFPEQFPSFMGLTAEQLSWLQESHPSLFDYRWWQTLREQLHQGLPREYPAYPEQSRLCR
ncbi:bifunctional isocitrate dehydrogenase kinase/phosphatase [Gammaproteobacteria bacterium AB-CW1]|uniref:Isocitrate dehydrogenase kinase/phosphatase n=1 Tax=Natronospira elongata TaxID=3110268 RepID=A0AAP6MK83_9GAMM|nr:bifunctional isocitrate dehydrogenase kinase/phosphatase [Gammaproteobacteria bacterium AB-CW1]